MKKFSKREIMIGALAVILVVMVGAFASSGDMFQGKFFGTKCAQDNHCGDGYKCIKNTGKCAKLAIRCQKHADCGIGYYCHDTDKTCVRKNQIGVKSQSPYTREANPKTTSISGEAKGK